MKLLTGLLAAVLLLAGVGTSQAVVRIADDRGGRIGTYVDQYSEVRNSGERVVIDGAVLAVCTSATINAEGVSVTATTTTPTPHSRR